MLLRDDGMSYGEIARVLFLSDEGVRQQIEDFAGERKAIGKGRAFKLA